MKTIRVCAAILATAVAIAALSGVAQATPVAYIIDATQSYATSTGTLLGAPLSAQVLGSDTDALQGMIVGDLTLGTLTLSGGSTVDLILNPLSPFLPAGVGEDNVGLFSVAFAVNIAARDILIDLPAGSIMNGVAPLGMTTKVVAGHNDIQGFGIFSAIRPAVANTTALLASITIAGGIETVKIPFHTVDVNGTTNTAITDGLIVAMRPIPEPSTVVLAGLGVVGMALAAWRKRHAA